MALAEIAPEGGELTLAPVDDAVAEHATDEAPRDDSRDGALAREDTVGGRPDTEHDDQKHDRGKDVDEPVDEAHDERVGVHARLHTLPRRAEVSTGTAVPLTFVRSCPPPNSSKQWSSRRRPPAYADTAAPVDHHIPSSSAARRERGSSGPRRRSITSCAEVTSKNVGEIDPNSRRAGPLRTERGARRRVRETCGANEDGRRRGASVAVAPARVKTRRALTNFKPAAVRDRAPNTDTCSDRARRARPPQHYSSIAPDSAATSHGHREFGDPRRTRSRLPTPLPRAFVGCSARRARPSGR